MATLTIPVIFTDDKDNPLTHEVYIPLIPDVLDISGVRFQVTEVRYVLDDGRYRVTVKDIADERTPSTSAKEGKPRVHRR